MNSPNSTWTRALRTRSLLISRLRSRRWRRNLFVKSYDTNLPAPTLRRGITRLQPRNSSPSLRIILSLVFWRRCTFRLVNRNFSYSKSKKHRHNSQRQLGSRAALNLSLNLSRCALLRHRLLLANTAMRQPLTRPSLKSFPRAVGPAMRDLGLL